MNCAHCTTPIPEGYRFCPACGAGLTLSPEIERFQRICAVVDAAREINEQAVKTEGEYEGNITVVLNFGKLHNALRALDDGDA